MIVAFAVDPDALAAREPEVHHRLLDLWRRQGILVYPGAKLRESRLYDAIAALPVSLRKPWKETLTYAWRSSQPGGMELTSVQQRDQLGFLTGVANVACLEETRAHCLGIPDGRLAERLPEIDIEICRMEGVDRTEAFLTAGALANGWIKEASSVSRVWQERFQRAARAARNITLVDRYAIEQHLRRPHDSGLRRFLLNLHRDARHAYVKIYSQPVEGCPTEAVADALRKEVQPLGRGGIWELSIILVPENRFWRLSHQRYLRFDLKVCVLDTGIQVLQGERVDRDASIQLVLHDEVTRRKEAGLDEKTEVVLRVELGPE